MTIRDRPIHMITFPDCVATPLAARRLHPGYGHPCALRRADLLAVRRHERDHGIGGVRDKLQIVPQRFDRPRSRDAVAVGTHHSEVAGQRLGGVGDGLLERIAGGDAAGHVRKADAVAGVLVLVDERDVTRH